MWGLFSSCISEDYSNCSNRYVVDLSYTGDGKDEIFPDKINNVRMYIFDEVNSCIYQTQLTDQEVKAQRTLLPPMEEGFCRVTVDHYKNGRVLIKAADRPGFVKQGEILPKGTVLQIIALPDAGYGIGAVNVVSETAIHTDDGRMLTVTLEESCSVGVLFGELSSAQSAAE